MHKDLPFVNGSMELHDVRLRTAEVKEKGGSTLVFVVKDICKMLGLQNPQKASLACDPSDVYEVITTSGTVGNRVALAVNITGLCHILFSCRKEAARPYKVSLSNTLHYEGMLNGYSV